MIKQVISKPEVSFWIALLSPTIAIAVTWGVMSTEINHLDAMTNGLQTKMSKHIEISEQRFNEQDTTDSEILVRLAQIQKDIEFLIKQRD